MEQLRCKANMVAHRHGEFGPGADLRILSNNKNSTQEKACANANFSMLKIGQYEKNLSYSLMHKTR